jgi:hypothetical protein
MSVLPFPNLSLRLVRANREIVFNYPSTGFIGMNRGTLSSFSSRRRLFNHGFGSVKMRRSIMMCFRQKFR